MPYCLRKDNLRTVPEIQQLTDRYHDYIKSEMPSADKVYLSNVFEKEELEKILLGNDGIRVMLVKEDDVEATDGKAALKGQARVSLIAVPVKKIFVRTDGVKDDSSDFHFENRLASSDNVIYEECPSKYCDSSTTKRLLL